MPLIREVSIENYKSIRTIRILLGRVNILIGANGSGKTNVLEGIVLGSARSRGKFDNEYLVPRGVRVTDPQFMRSALGGVQPDAPTSFRLGGDGGVPYGGGGLSPTPLQTGGPEAQVDAVMELLRQQLPQLEGRDRQNIERVLTDRVRFRKFIEDALLQRPQAPDFAIFSPENSALRIFQSGEQVLPLGVRGEGLFGHLKSLGSTPEGTLQLAEIGERLALLDWFERFEIPKDLAPEERSIKIRDRYLAEGALFDQRSANEGFLFLLFYFTLAISRATPPVFAIENVDASLNPKLCKVLVQQLAQLALKHDKQLLLTTHNPSVLDGLDLTDAEQRLFVVERTKNGATHVRRARAAKPLDDEPPIALSEAFLKGYLGGLPKNF